MKMRCRRKLAAHGLGIGIDTGLFKMEPAILRPTLFCSSAPAYTASVSNHQRAVRTNFNPVYIVKVKLTDHHS